MKKITSLRQLQQEKKRILQEKSEAEKRIRSQWEDLKHSIKPSSLAKDTLSHAVQQENEDGQESDSIFKSTLVYGMTLLAKKLADRIEHKISRLNKS
jgi:hypothetical protein